MRKNEFMATPQFLYFTVVIILVYIGSPLYSSIFILFEYLLKSKTNGVYRNKSRGGKFFLAPPLGATNPRRGGGKILTVNSKYLASWISGKV